MYFEKVYSAVEPWMHALWFLCSLAGIYIYKYICT